MANTLPRLVDAVRRLARDEPIHDALRNSQSGPTTGQAVADALRSCKRAHRQLDLYGVSLSDQGAIPLLHMLVERPGCTSLDLGDNGIGAASAVALAPLLLVEPPPAPEDLFLLPGEDEVPRHLLPDTVPVSQLRLARNGSSFDGAACAALLGDHLDAPFDSGVLALTSLGLSFNALGGAGAAALGRALRAVRLPHLGCLQLQGCSLGEEGARALADGLPCGTALWHLDVSDNSIGDSGACALAAVLPSAPALLELLLVRNGLDDTAAHALATALVKRSGGAAGCRLTLLSLAHNQIRSRGAVALADALGAKPPNGNRTLSTLDLRGNRLGPSALLALGDALVANAALTELTLAHNRRLTPDSLAALDVLLRQNRLAADGLAPSPRVAPNENAATLVDYRVQKLFTQPSATAAAAASLDALGGRGLPRGVSGGVSGFGGRGRGAGWDEDTIARDGRLEAEMRAALSTMQEDIAASGREVARLRQREAVLEQVLRREAGLRPPPGGSAWECVTLG